MVKVMGVFKGTDAIQNKIIKIDFTANLKRLVIWLLKLELEPPPPYPYSNIVTFIGSSNMRRFGQQGHQMAEMKLGPHLRP